MPASKKEAKEFVKRWQKRLAAIPAGSNNEQQDTQKFWVDLLINVLGIPSNTIDSFVDFERKVRGRRIDVFVSDHNFLCEQKSWGIDLDKPEPRNGGMETPLQQAVSVNIVFTISTNAFSPIAPTRIRRIRQRGCAAFGA